MSGLKLLLHFRSKCLHLCSEISALGGFDLNAVGDEDDDGDDDGQVDTYNQDTSEGQGDGNDGMNEQDDVDRRSVYVGNVRKAIQMSDSNSTLIILV